MSVEIYIRIVEGKNQIMGLDMDLNGTQATLLERKALSEVVELIKAFGQKKSESSGIGGVLEQVVNTPEQLESANRIGKAMIAAAELAVGNSYTCPHCGKVSYNPGDNANKYCSACKQFNH